MLVGTVAGALVGGIGGGLAGKAIAEHVNPTQEHGFWRENYASRGYAAPGASYDEYGPAYQFGWETQARNPGQTFEQAEPSLRSDWEKAKGASNLRWEDAKEAVHDAWERVAKRHDDQV
jgi:hypothetical protein